MLDIYTIAFIIIVLLRILLMLFPQIGTVFQNKNFRNIRWSGNKRNGADYSELYRLLYGDRAAAHRLVNDVARNYPEKDINWCIRKAIRDLEYDRSR